MADKAQGARSKGGKKGTTESEKGKSSKDKEVTGGVGEIDEPPMIIKGSSQGPFTEIPGSTGFEWQLDAINPLDFSFNPQSPAPMPNNYRLPGMERVCGFVVLDSAGETIYKFPNDTDEGRYQILITFQTTTSTLIINGSSAGPSGMDCFWEMRSTTPLDYKFDPNTSVTWPNSYMLPGGAQASRFVILNADSNPIYVFPNAVHSGPYSIGFED